MKLYGTPPTRATRPIWLLNALDIDCEIVPLDMMAGENQGAEFLAVNPFGKIPALVDGDLMLAESVAIMMHLAEAHGGERFLPSDPADRARMHQWNLYLVAEIEQPLWRMGLHSVIYPEAERISEDIPLARRDCLRMLAPLEAHLKGRDHMVGSALTVADFNAAYTLDWADEDGCLLDAAPNCRRFVERMYARPDAPPRIAEAFAKLNAGEVPPRYRVDIAPEKRILPCAS